MDIPRGKGPFDVPVDLGEGVVFFSRSELASQTIHEAVLSFAA